MLYIPISSPLSQRCLPEALRYHALPRWQVIPYPIEYCRAPRMMIESPEQTQTREYYFADASYTAVVPLSGDGALHAAAEEPPGHCQGWSEAPCPNLQTYLIPSIKRTE